MHFYFDGVIIKASAKENPIDDRKRKNKKSYRAFKASAEGITKADGADLHFYFDGVIIKASAKENPIDDRKRKNKKSYRAFKGSL